MGDQLKVDSLETVKEPPDALKPLQVRRILTERWLRSATDPWRQMLAVAAKISADLLVIATHGRAGLAHLLQPNHADPILREAPCPVLVVRSPHAPGPAEPA
jgi:nucleotide-binding universal stress UspA family protein